MTQTTTRQKPDLKVRWEKLLAQNNKLRIRDAAAELGVSEAQLLATDCGDTVTRLEVKNWFEFYSRFKELGRVMVLTRNDSCVHERKGSYEQITEQHGVGLVLGADIDLRIFFKEWALAFSVCEPQNDGSFRRSFQFFNAAGVAVHKVYLEDEARAPIFDALTKEFASEDQSPEQSVTPPSPPRGEMQDEMIDVQGFRKAWAELKDTHDFYMLLGKFRVGRLQAMRLAAPEMVEELRADQAERMLRLAAERNIEIMCFVSSDGVVQIHTGPVKNIQAYGPWINVMDPDFNLHLRADHIHKLYLVRKPTTDGLITSVEAFDTKGGLIVQFFGKRKPGLPEREDWRALCAELSRA